MHRTTNKNTHAYANCFCVTLICVKPKQTNQQKSTIKNVQNNLNRFNFNKQPNQQSTTPHHPDLTQLHTTTTQQQEQDPTNLYIANLPPHFKETDLEAMLSKYGQVVSTRILRDQQMNSKGE